MDAIFRDSPYVSTKKLGSGSFGQVYRGRHRDTRKLVALKIIDWKAPKRLPAEIRLLKNLKHDNIVRLIAYERNHEENKLRLVLEYMPTDLRRYLINKRSEGGIPPRTIKSLMHQLLTGIEFCHANKILHRDLKPANLLVDGKGNLKIGDFGLAIANRRRRLASYVVTRWYRSPDVLLGNTNYGTGIDIWSVGCIMAEMFTGDPLFRGDSMMDQIDRIFRVFGTPTEEDWPGLERLPRYRPDWEVHDPQELGDILPMIDPLGIELLEEMLQVVPEERISAAEALVHPWFVGVKKKGGKERK